MGDERIEAEEQAHPEDSERVERATTDRNGSDRARSEVRDHDRVHNVHRDPSQLRESNRDGKRDDVANFAEERRARLGPNYMDWFRNLQIPGSNYSFGRLLSDAIRGDGLELFQVVQVMPSHRLHNGSECHSTALRVCSRNFEI